jgi:acyl carrier protein
VSAAEIADDLPLFGPGGLGLDSVDALQLVLALDKQFGLKIRDPEAAKEILRNVNTIAEAVQRKTASEAGLGDGGGSVGGETGASRLSRTGPLPRGEGESSSASG